MEYYAIIPAYQPDEQLITLTKQLKQYQQMHIIIVDDGSSINKQSIFIHCEPFATILHHKHNQGKGCALKTAFLYLMKQNQQGIVVCVDADGQHQIQDIIKVCQRAEQTPHAITCGVRSFQGKVPFKSRWGNLISKHVYKLVCGISLPDTQCGLRAFTSDLLPFLYEIKGNRYEYEMNVLLNCATHYPIEPVDIKTIYIEANQASHFRPLQDAFRIYKEILCFVTSSILSFLIDYLIFSLIVFMLDFLPTTERIIYANSIARICSATFNYKMNKNYVFATDNQQSFLRYIILAAFILLINTNLAIILETLGINNLYVLKLIVESLLFLLSWFIQKNFVFRKEVIHEKN